MRLRLAMPLLLLLLLVTVMACAADSRAVGEDAQQIRRVDGSYITTGEVEEYVSALMDRAGVMGLQMAIINGSDVVFEHEWGSKSRVSPLVPDRQTVFPALSFSKPTFACLVMRLVESGLLDLDRPLVAYLKQGIGEYPQWADLENDPRMQEVTARRVLTHTTGWPNFRAMLDGGELTFMYVPGERFSYSGEAFNFLQLVVEEITGEPLDALAREKMFAPLDMTLTSYVWEPEFEANHADGHTETQRRIKLVRRGEPSAAGSMATTASDFAKLLLAVLHGRGLEQSSIDEMLAPQVPVVSRRMFGPMASQDTEENEAIHLAWGLGWGLFDTDFGPAFFHTGEDVGWENYTVTYVDREVGIVLLSNSSNFSGIAQRIVEYVIGDRSSPFTWLGYEPFDPSVPPPVPEPEPETVAIDPAIFDAVVGQYEVQPGDYVFLRVENGRLVGSGDGFYWDAVMAVSETEFFIDGKSYGFTFSRAPDGTVTGMIISFQDVEIPARKIR